MEEEDESESVSVIPSDSSFNTPLHEPQRWFTDVIFVKTITGLSDSSYFDYDKSSSNKSKLPVGSEQNPLNEVQS